MTAEVPLRQLLIEVQRANHLDPNVQDHFKHASPFQESADALTRSGLESRDCNSYVAPNVLRPEPEGPRPSPAAIADLLFSSPGLSDYHTSPASFPTSAKTSTSASPATLQARHNLARSRSGPNAPTSSKLNSSSKSNLRDSLSPKANLSSIQRSNQNQSPNLSFPSNLAPVQRCAETQPGLLVECYDLLSRQVLSIVRHGRRRSPWTLAREASLPPRLSSFRGGFFRGARGVGCGFSNNSAQISSDWGREVFNGRLRQTACLFFWEDYCDFTDARAARSDLRNVWTSLLRSDIPFTCFLPALQYILEQEEQAGSGSTLAAFLPHLLACFTNVYCGLLTECAIWRYIPLDRRLAMRRFVMRYQHADFFAAGVCHCCVRRVCSKDLFAVFPRGIVMDCSQSMINATADLPALSPDTQPSTHTPTHTSHTHPQSTHSTPLSSTSTATASSNDGLQSDEDPPAVKRKQTETTFQKAEDFSLQTRAEEALRPDQDCQVTLLGNKEKTLALPNTPTSLSRGSIFSGVKEWREFEALLRMSCGLWLDQLVPGSKFREVQVNDCVANDLLRGFRLIAGPGKNVFDAYRREGFHFLQQSFEALYGANSVTQELGQVVVRDFLYSSHIGSMRGESNDEADSEYFRSVDDIRSPPSHCVHQLYLRTWLLIKFSMGGGSEREMKEVAPILSEKLVSQTIEEEYDNAHITQHFLSQPSIVASPLLGAWHELSFELAAINKLYSTHLATQKVEADVAAFTLNAFVGQLAETEMWPPALRVIAEEHLAAFHSLDTLHRPALDLLPLDPQQIRSAFLTHTQPHRHTVTHHTQTRTHTHVNSDPTNDLVGQTCF